MHKTNYLLFITFTACHRCVCLYKLYAYIGSFVKSIIAFYPRIPAAAPAQGSARANIVRWRRGKGRQTRVASFNYFEPDLPVPARDREAKEAVGVADL